MCILLNTIFIDFAGNYLAQVTGTLFWELLIGLNYHYSLTQRRFPLIFYTKQNIINFKNKPIFAFENVFLVILLCMVTGGTFRTYTVDIQNYIVCFNGTVVFCAEMTWNLAQLLPST